MKRTLEMKNIVKRFPGVVANDDVSFALNASEIHALLGENGAGKSTLMQILYGFYAMNSGEILIDGQRLDLRSPRDAIAAGIGMVHQEFMLISTLSVVENVILGLRKESGWRLDLRASAKRLKDLSDRYGLALDPDAEVGSLPIGVQQRVEIAKALYRDANVLILDEPTAVLTPGEKDRLFSVLRELRAGGRSVVIVTHKLTEIIELADRVTVMRSGRVVATKAVQSTSKRDLAQLMMGRDVELRAAKTASKVGETILRVEGLQVKDDLAVERLHDLGLDVRAGEILGIAGVDGNGQSELAQGIMGLRKVAGGRVFLSGVDVTHLGVSQRRALGMSYVPADRRTVGSVADMSIRDNAILGLQRQHTRGLFLSDSSARGAATTIVERFRVRGAGVDSHARKLSGGNLQKLILGRELMRATSALIVEQPTRGLDAGAVESVWKELLLARQEGKAILLISAELEELLNLADRIAVIYGGRITGSFEAPFPSVDAFGPLMAGVRSSE
jgi:general nucleoside transport system ATP-binding protein